MPDLNAKLSDDSLKDLEYNAQAIRTIFIVPLLSFLKLDTPNLVTSQQWWTKNGGLGFYLYILSKHLLSSKPVQK